MKKLILITAIALLVQVLYGSSPSWQQTTNIVQSILGNINVASSSTTAATAYTANFAGGIPASSYVGPVMPIFTNWVNNTQTFYFSYPPQAGMTNPFTWYAAGNCYTDALGNYTKFVSNKAYVTNDASTTNIVSNGLGPNSYTSLSGWKINGSLSNWICSAWYRTPAAGMSNYYGFPVLNWGVGSDANTIYRMNFAGNYQGVANSIVELWKSTNYMVSWSYIGVVQPSQSWLSPQDYSFGINGNGVMVFIMSQYNPNSAGAITNPFVMMSTDGVNWNTNFPLISSALFPVSGNGDVVDVNGQIRFNGLNASLGAYALSGATIASWCLSTTNGGTNWAVTSITNSSGPIEPQIYQVNANQLLLDGRGTTYQSVDNGATWSKYGQYGTWDAFISGTPTIPGQAIIRGLNYPLYCSALTIRNIGGWTNDVMNPNSDAVWLAWTSLGNFLTEPLTLVSNKFAIAQQSTLPVTGSADGGYATMIFKGNDVWEAHEFSYGYGQNPTIGRNSATLGFFYYKVPLVVIQTNVVTTCTIDTNNLGTLLTAYPNLILTNSVTNYTPIIQ